MRDGVNGGLGVDIGGFESGGDLVKGLADAGIGAAHGCVGVGSSDRVRICRNTVDGLAP